MHRSQSLRPREKSKQRRSAAGLWRERGAEPPIPLQKDYRTLDALSAFKARGRGLHFDPGPVVEEKTSGARIGQCLKPSPIEAAGYKAEFVPPIDFPLGGTMQVHWFGPDLAVVEVERYEEKDAEQLEAA
jgi:hypothetical protein